MARTVGWFSCGVASAVACMLTKPDVLVYCETGSEHRDNGRFRRDFEKAFRVKVKRLKSDAFKDTWEVWERKRYLSGVSGAPCTRALKVLPRLAFQEPGDVHIFGYTNDKADRERAERLRETWKDIDVRFPLIDAKLTKANCLSLMAREGIKPPVTYAMGMPNANCIPCVKATSPAYWALIRKRFPIQFWRMARLSRELGVRLARHRGERVYIDEIPRDHAVSGALAPSCDMLCDATELKMDNQLQTHERWKQRRFVQVTLI